MLVQNMYHIVPTFLVSKLFLVSNYGTIQYYNFIFIAVILNGKLIYVTLFVKLTII